jgi:hypothetical protein
VHSVIHRHHGGTKRSRSVCVVQHLYWFKQYYLNDKIERLDILKNFESRLCFSAKWQLAQMPLVVNSNTIYGHSVGMSGASRFRFCSINLSRPFSLDCNGSCMMMMDGFDDLLIAAVADSEIGLQVVVQHRCRRFPKRHVATILLVVIIVILILVGD